MSDVRGSSTVVYDGGGGGGGAGMLDGGCWCRSVRQRNDGWIFFFFW